MNRQRVTSDGRFEPIFKKLHKRLSTYGDRFKDLDPIWSKKTIFTIIQNAILSLKSQIENPEQGEVTWAKPFLEIRYAVKTEWEGDKFTFIPDEIGLWSFTPLLGLVKPVEATVYDFLNTRDFCILRSLTEDLVHLNRDKPLILFFKELDRPEVWDRLLKVKQKRETRLKKITKPFTFKIEDAVSDEKGRTGKAKWTLNVFFKPLIVDTYEREAHFPIHAELKFRGPPPFNWSEKDKEKFWDPLLYNVRVLIPNVEVISPVRLHGPTRIEGMAELPKPVVVPPKIPFIPASLHTEKQKFDCIPFESLYWGTAQRAKEVYGLQEVGLDLTQAQSQALWAIQKLLWETKYEGNPSAFIGQSALKVTPAKYLEAYGVSKYQTSRGYMEFSGEERRQALQALGDLVRNHIFVYYDLVWWEKKGGQVVVRRPRHPRETIDSLIEIKQGPKALMRQVAKLLDSGKATKETDDRRKIIIDTKWEELGALLDSIEPAKETDDKAIVLLPSPILVAQIENYFVPKPLNYRQEIKLLVGHGSKYIYNFIDYLLTQVAERESHSRGGGNEDWLINISLKDLAYALRMNSWIKTRNWKQIRGSLKKCYETAQKLGYIISYEIDIPGKKETLDRLTLNPKKFGRMSGP